LAEIPLDRLPDPEHKAASFFVLRARVFGAIPLGFGDFMNQHVFRIVMFMPFLNTLSTRYD
jgi:hypothetical protein